MAFKMKAGKDGPMKKNFPSVFKKDDGKKNKSKADIELDSILTPASQDTMAFKTSPGFVDYLKRNDFTSADIVKIIKNTDKNQKNKLKMLYLNLNYWKVITLMVLFVKMGINQLTICFKIKKSSFRKRKNEIIAH